MPLPELPELEELYRLYRTDLYRYLCDKLLHDYFEFARGVVEGAYDLLYVVNRSRNLTHDPAEAEDLLSETFLRALKRLHTYRGDCAVKTWLFGIARNIWLEGLRKKHPTASTDDLLEGCLAEDTLTERTDSRLQWQRVKELLQQGDDRARRVVQLRAMGYSYNEIAAELHISESSARVIEHRTRTWLKQMLAKEGYDL